jgi:hypothetical protein
MSEICETSNKHTNVWDERGKDREMCGGRPDSVDQNHKLQISSSEINRDKKKGLISEDLILGSPLSPRRPASIKVSCQVVDGQPRRTASQVHYSTNLRWRDNVTDGRHRSGPAFLFQPITPVPVRLILRVPAAFIIGSRSWT